MLVAANLILSFCIYSFLGWLCETVYCSLPKGELVNRGFLSGPFCPVYGFGALLVVYLLRPFARLPVLLFLAAVVLTSALEYATGYLLERLFHTKWWDYSKRVLNLHGRVCLRNSLLFGLMASFVVLLLDPAVQRLLLRLPGTLSLLLAAAMVCYFAADTVSTVRGILSLQEHLEKLEALREEVREKTRRYREEFEQNLSERREELAENRQERREQMQARIDALTLQLSGMRLGSRRVHRRLLRAFPGMRSQRHQGGLEQMREALEELRRQRREKQE